MSVVDKDASIDKEKVFYKEAFEAFDWNRNGTIPTSVSYSLQVFHNIHIVSTFFVCDI